MSRVDGSNEVFKLTNATIVRDTGRAILVKFAISPDDGGDGEDHTEWFPLSQVTKLITASATGLSEVVVKRWLLTKKEYLE